MVEHFYVVFVSEMKILRIILLFECQKRAKQMCHHCISNTRNSTGLIMFMFFDS